MVIGRLPSGLNEENHDFSPSPITEEYQSPTSVQNSILSDGGSQSHPSVRNSDECTSSVSIPGSGPSEGCHSTRQSWADQEKSAPKQDPVLLDQVPVVPEKPLSGKRWGVLMRERKADLIELVRI